jgi:signal transduction histidine kinase
MRAAARTVHDQLEKPRRISAELGSVLLDTLGLPAAIEWRVHRFQQRTGIACELALRGSFALPEAYAATIFDICNEALSNVARHAQASKVFVALSIAPHEIAVVVRDNGKGLPTEAAASKAGGLAAIRARSRSYKGICEVAGAQRAGTTVVVCLPIA